MQSFFWLPCLYEGSATVAEVETSREGKNEKNIQIFYEDYVETVPETKKMFSWRAIFQNTGKARKKIEPSHAAIEGWNQHGE